MTKTIYLNDTKTCYTIDETGVIINTNTGKELKGTITEHGYRKIMFSINGKKIGKYLHRLMGIYFLGLDETSNKVVNHKDGNKLNNNLDNLEIITSKENSFHAYNNGLRDTNKGKRCESFMENLPGELWKKVPLYPDYEVSNLGRVKSFKYTHPILLRNDIRCGYYSVVLSSKGQTRHFQVHELVYFTFTGEERSTNKVIDHIDGNKLNNCLDNLRYISRKDNLNAAIYEQKLTNKCKKVAAYQDGEYVACYYSIAEASRSLGVDGSTISKICRGKAKSAHGYTF